MAKHWDSFLSYCTVMQSPDQSCRVGPSDTSPYPIPKAELITTLPSKERFHALLHLVVPLAVGGRIVGSRGTRHIVRRLGGMHGFDGGDKEGAVATGHLAVGSLAEVVTTPDDVVELHLSLGQGEVLVKTHCYARSGGLIQSKGSAGMPKAVYD